MFNLNLNKKIKKYNQGISGLELLKTVDKNLQKECIAVEVNDKIKDDPESVVPESQSS